MVDHTLGILPHYTINTGWPVWSRLPSPLIQPYYSGARMSITLWGSFSTPPLSWKIHPWESSRTLGQRICIPKIFWLGHFSCAKGHSNKRYEQSSSLPVHKTPAVDMSEHFLPESTHLRISLCLWCSPPKIPSFRETFHFPEAVALRPLRQPKVHKFLRHLHFKTTRQWRCDKLQSANL